MNMHHTSHKAKGSSLYLQHNGLTVTNYIMSRPLRIEYPGCWYHVINRGRRKENIFLSTTDYQLFLKAVQEAAELFGLHVSAFCLMPNHYHLLVQTPHGNLSRCMRHINGVYTQRFNRNHDYDGQLFRGRYKAVLVEDDRHLLQVMRYIHQNPVKAGMTGRLKDFPWSSHHAYLSSAKKWDWLYKTEILNILERRKTQQRAAYKEFVAQDIPEEIESFYSGKRLSSLLGSNDFIERVKLRFGKSQFEQELTTTTDLSISADQILEVVATGYGIKKSELITSKRGENNFPRDLAMYLIKHYRMDTLKTIAGYFGAIHYSTVSNGIARAKRMIESDARYRHQLEEIEKNYISFKKRLDPFTVKQCQILKRILPCL